MNTTDTLAHPANRLAANCAATIAATAHSPLAYQLATVAYRRATDIVIAVNTTPLPAHVYDLMYSLHRIVTDLTEYTDTDNIQAAWLDVDEGLPQ
jgi:hypothetical protein